MRNVDCIICKSEKKQVLMEQAFKDYYIELINPAYYDGERKIVICEDCGFVYRDPQLDAEDLKILYDRFRDMSLRGEAPDAYFDRITSLPPAESENTAKAAWLTRHIYEHLAKPGRHLDIGCGGGVFIHTFLEKNPDWLAFGVEPTPAFAEVAGRRLNRPVICGSYRSGLFPGKFDLITINQVLEHIQDPVAFLKDVQSDLAPNGMVYIEVPDILDFGHLPAEHDRFLVQHLWIFSEASLTNVCQQAGYEINIVDHQITVRGKRNVIVVLTNNATKSSKTGLTCRDTVESIRSLM